MSCKARLTAVAEEVAGRLCRSFDPASNTTVAREYAPDWFDPDYFLNNPNLTSSFTGRRVFVFGSAERHQGAATRGEDDNHYVITVVAFEKFTDADRVPTTDWVDERVAWVESEIFDRLGDARAPERDETVANSIPVSQEWNIVYSPTLLAELKLFRSEVIVIYRRIEDLDLD